MGYKANPQTLPAPVYWARMDEYAKAAERSRNDRLADMGKDFDRAAEGCKVHKRERPGVSSSQKPDDLDAYAGPWNT